jgi:hypothetical protein
MMEPEKHHEIGFSGDEGTYVTEQFLLWRRTARTSTDVRIHVSLSTLSAPLGVVPAARSVNGQTRGGLAK